MLYGQIGILIVLLKNEIVIKPYGDGTCQYLSNKVQKIELDIPVYEEY